MSRVRRVTSLTRTLVKRDLKIRYQRSLLDAAWAIITPAVLLGVYGVVLTQSFDVTGTCSPYLTSAWVGLVTWTFFATALGSAVTSLVGASELVTKVYFPREALPLASTGAALLDLAIGFASVVVIMFVQGVSFQVTAIGVVLPLLVIVVWSAALGILLAVLAVFVRDLVHGVHLALRVGFFASPVVYEASFLPSAFEWSARFNPVAVSLTGIRDTLLCGEWAVGGLLWVHLGVGLALLAVGVRYSRAMESAVADTV